MEKQVRHQVHSGIEAVESAVQLVGNPRQRMPVGIGESCEGPADPTRTQSLQHHRVCGDIFLVIEPDEFMGT